MLNINNSFSTSRQICYDSLTDSGGNGNNQTSHKGGAKGEFLTSEARREYKRRYYQMHKEKAKEYQRQYNLTHKKKARVGSGRSGFTAPREIVRTTFNTTDIMHAPVEKTIRILEKIIKGERFFTM